ncbi:CX3C chemokine receptor 1 [Lampris incognitus]|uniref:CX3C chemokine receptor 1 n=1 Tax=Lampris incognitus TaxID=2546036 RepID=UPI0024B58A79|nr:CX3C chemokine receptor 1 [Lampris incognitus]
MNETKGPENTTSLYEYDLPSTPCEMTDSGPLSIYSTVLPILLYLMFCFGLLGNATILWVLLRYMKLKAMTDICLFNLALSDLILALSLPLFAYKSHNHLGFYRLPLCKLKTGVYQLGFYSGTLSVTFMSIDRYLAIVHAMAATQVRTLSCGIAVSIAIWVASTVMALPQVWFAAEDDDSDVSSHECQLFYPDNTSRLWKSLKNVGENTMGVFLCLPILTFCYVRILYALQKSRNSRKSRAVKLIFIIVCVFVVCWVPYNVIVFLKTLQLFDILNSCEASKTFNFVLFVAEIISLVHCCVNPVIYAFVGEKFRMSLRKMLSRYPFLRRLSRQVNNKSHHGSETETSNTHVRSD